MATLAAGDVTTQLRLWINANAAGVNVNEKIQAAATTALVIPATTEPTVALSKFIAR